MECLEYCPPHESDHVLSHGSSLQHMTQCLLGGPTLLSNFVDEGDRLSDIGLDVLEFALVAEDLSGVKASGDKREAFLFTVGLKL